MCFLKSFAKCEKEFSNDKNRDSNLISLVLIVNRKVIININNACSNVGE